VNRIYFKRADEGLLRDYEIAKRKHFMSQVNLADAKLSSMEKKMNAKLGILPASPTATPASQPAQPLPHVEVEDPRALLNDMLRGRRVA
jgi:hypothetical protein